MCVCVYVCVCICSEFELGDYFVGVRGCAVVVLRSTGFNQHTGMYVCMCVCMNV